MRKTKDDYLNNLKTELDKGNNLIDYFITIGINEDVIFSNFLYENDINTLNSSELIKPEILSKFPPIEKKNVIVDENIIRHCFPNGFSLIESNELPGKNSFYFVLDNNHSSIEYPQKFMACLVFYEKLESYKKAFKKYQSDIDLRYSSYHISKNLKNKRENSNLDYSNLSEYDIYHTNSTNSNLNNNYVISQNMINNNLTVNNNNNILVNFETENDLNNTNQNIIYNNNNYTYNNESLHQKKNSLGKMNNSINSNNSDNSTNPNNLSTLNNLTHSNSNNSKNINENNQYFMNNPIKSENCINNSAVKTPGIQTSRNLRTPLLQMKCISESLNQKNCPIENEPNLGFNYQNYHQNSVNLNNNSNYNLNSNNSNNFNTNNSLNFNTNQNQNIYPGSYNTNQILSENTQTVNNPLANGIRSNSLRSSYSSINTISGVSKKRSKNIYIPKCICLVSVHPFCNELINILEAIYSFTSTNTKLKRPLEKIIENLVIEIPLPPRGLYTINYELFDKTFVFRQSKMNDLPYISFNLEQIFMNFDIDQMLEIFKHLLLETRLIFFSKEMKILSPIIHGFVTLIYPFKYPFNYITVIPQENFTILENVTPFIIGINQSYSPGFFEQNEIDISEINFLIIDIDNKKVDLHCYLAKNKDENMRKKIIKKEFPNLPEHYKNKLYDKLKEYFSNIKSTRKTVTKNHCHSQAKETNENFVKTIRGYFYQFMVSIFLNYARYLNYEYYNNKNMSIPSVKNLFKVDEFLCGISNADRPFYMKFILETQQFADFIYKRMIPKDSKEKLEILLFDEHITEKNNRKYFSKKTITHFLNTEMYDFKNIYYVEKQRQMSDFEKKYFIEYENRKSALRYGQEILFEKDGEITISYFYFPTLMTNFYFYNNIKNYIMPRNLSEELEQINIEMVSKSHLGNIEMKETVMENYIYLCWAQLWAMTFWYHDQEEKPYRFKQLLNVLDRLGHYEIEIFNLLFESINKYGDESMVIELYNKMLLKYKLYPTYSICTIFNKIMDKKNNAGRLNNARSKESGFGASMLNASGFQKKNTIGDIKMLNSNYVHHQKRDLNNPNNTHQTIDLDEFEKGKFRLRSIKSKNDDSEISDNYIFLDYYPCVECQTPIDLHSICRNFKDMKKDLEWALCNYCNTKILPKLRVKYSDKKHLNDDVHVFYVRKESGSSINSEHHNCNESEVLYSPFHLKYNFYNSSFIENRLKLDVDYFKIKFNAIFWNSIWYFKIKDLPYDFISPYNQPPAERLKMQISQPITQNKGSLNRFDSIQNLITFKNSSQMNENKNSKNFESVNSIRNSGKSFKNEGNNIEKMSNSFSLRNSMKKQPSYINNQKFVEDDMERILINKESEIYLDEQYNNSGGNVFKKAVDIEVNEQEYKNVKEKEDNHKENFSSLKTFENLIMNDNSDLESEINKPNDLGQNIKLNRNYIISGHNSDLDQETKKNLNNFFKNSDVEEYNNLAFKSFEINKENDFAFNNNYKSKSKINDISRKFPILDNTNENDEVYRKAKTNINEIKNFVVSKNNFNELNDQKNFDLSNKTVFNNNLTGDYIDKKNSFLNLSNHSFSNNLMNLSYNSSRINKNNQLNSNNLENFQNNPSKVDSNQNNFINIKENNIEKNFTNFNNDKMIYLNKLNSSDRKKLSYDFQLYKGISLMQSFNDASGNNSINNSNNILQNNNENILSSLNREYESNLRINSKLSICNKSNGIFKEKIISKSIKTDIKNEFENQRDNFLREQNDEENNLEISIYSDEGIISKRNEEKINISSKKLENIEIKSYDVCRHLNRKSELILDPIELEKMQTFYNINMNEEDKEIKNQFMKSFSPKEKLAINLNLNFEKSLKTDINLFNSKIAGDNQNTKYSNTYRGDKRDTFGNIFSNIEKEKEQLEFENINESNKNLQTMLTLNSFVSSSKSNESSYKDSKNNDKYQSEKDLLFTNDADYATAKDLNLNNFTSEENQHSVINSFKNNKILKLNLKFDNNDGRKDKVSNYSISNRTNLSSNNTNFMNENKNFTDSINNNTEFEIIYSNRSNKGKDEINKKSTKNLLQMPNDEGNELNRINFSNISNKIQGVNLETKNKAIRQFNSLKENISENHLEKDFSNNFENKEREIKSEGDFNGKKINSCLIISADDIIDNNINNNSSNSYLKINSNIEHSRKPSISRLKTIKEEAEKEKDSIFSYDNVVKVSSEKSGSNKFKKIDLNDNIKKNPKNKMIINRYNSLNIKDVIKDKKRLERININSRCNTEGIEEDSPKKNYESNDLSRISSKSDNISEVFVSGEKNSRKNLDRDRTPIKYNDDSSDLNEINRRFSSIKDLISGFKTTKQVDSPSYTNDKFDN